MDDDQISEVGDSRTVEHGQENRLITVEAARVGCATSQIVIENVEQSPSGEPFSDDCYTIRLHNPDHDQGISVSERSGKRAAGFYSNDLHIVRTHLFRRGGRIYSRRRVPDALRAIV